MKLLDRLGGIALCLIILVASVIAIVSMIKSSILWVHIVGVIVAVLTLVTILLFIFGTIKVFKE